VVDERPFQEKAAQALGLELQLITMDGSTFPEDLCRLLRYQDQPVVGAAMLPMYYVSKLAASKPPMDLRAGQMAVMWALAALMLVSTTIQLGVHSRRREIRIMQLVGATNNFIRAPFVIEGAVQGLIDVDTEDFCARRKAVVRPQKADAHHHRVEGDGTQW